MKNTETQERRERWAMYVFTGMFRGLSILRMIGCCQYDLQGQDILGSLQLTENDLKVSIVCTNNITCSFVIFSTPVGLCPFIKPWLLCYELQVWALQTVHGRAQHMYALYKCLPCFHKFPGGTLLETHLHNGIEHTHWGLWLCRNMLQIFNPITYTVVVQQAVSPDTILLHRICHLKV